MPRQSLIAMTLGLALFAAASAAQDIAPAPPAPPGPGHASDTALILYVPAKDLPRLPGYTTDGTLAPVTELLELAARAAARRESDWQSPAISFVELALDGSASGDLLALDGTLTWECGGSNADDAAEGWTAAVLDDGAWPWTLADADSRAPEPTAALPSQGLLARAGGKTVLLARGRGRGTLPVRAVWTLDPAQTAESITLGATLSPARIALRLDGGITIPSAERCVFTMEPAAADGARRAKLWPLPGQNAAVRFERAPVLDAAPGAPAIQSVWMRRQIMAEQGGMKVIDTLTLTGDFKTGRAVALTPPPGLNLLTTHMQKSATIETRDGRMIITPREDFPQMQFQAQFAALPRDGEAVIGPWELPAARQRTTLFLRPSDTQTPLPAALPSQFVAAAPQDGSTVYEIWGPLPALNVSLVPRAPEAAPMLAGELRVQRSEASLHYAITQFDARSGDLTFRSPEGWTLTGATALAGETPIPITLARLDGERWRLVYGAGTPVSAITLDWHRAGQWGAPGQEAALALPLAEVEGPPSLAHTLAVHWPEEFDVRADGLRGLTHAAIATESASIAANNPFGPSGMEQSALPAPPPDSPELHLRAAGDDPAGTLLIRGRESSRRATVVTLLNVGDDRARVRSMIEFDVRFAPASIFRFVLPAGTGAGVTIGGDGIRESAMQTGPEGDVWTVVTQHGVLGAMRLTAEWSLPAPPASGAFDAPEIRALDTTAQRGFLVLEGSETLRLTPETKNLAEADLVDVPPTPWSRAVRALAVWRYVEPPYSLRLTTSKFAPEPALEGLIEEARLTTSASADGQRLTRAAYTFRPVADRQFFEITLPAGAQLWATLVDGQGAKPARAAGAAKEKLLIPLPGQAGRGATVKIELIYREIGEPLAGVRVLSLPAPAPRFAVNKSVWELNLPPGFEYLRFEGALIEPVQPRLAALSFLRAAYYPERLVFERASLGRIIGASALLMIVTWIFLRTRRALRDGATRGPRPPKPEHSAGGSRVGVTIIQLFIILAIIAILAAIAVPNFLEAQVRSKVSRASSDLRSLATAIEAYAVDNNTYPPQQEILWQGAVKYISSSPNDPYSGTSDYDTDTYKYVTGREAQRRAIQLGLVAPEQAEQVRWLAYSVGPDGKDDMGTALYDPTNGTVSMGDVVRSNLGAASSFRGSFTSRLSSELDAERQIAAGQAGSRPDAAAMPASPPPAAAAPTSGDVWRPKPDDSKTDGMPVDRFAATTTDVDQVHTIAINGDAKNFQLLASDSSRIDTWGGVYRTAGLEAHQAGLLSLAIEVPEGGVQRRLEALGAESALTISLMPWERFQRTQFIVWMAMLVALGLLWARGGAAARVAFVIVVAAALLAPVLVRTAWVPFFNAALQGALFSLVVPLGRALWRLTLGRVHHDNRGGTNGGHSPMTGKSAAVSALIIILSLLMIGAAMADEPASAPAIAPPPALATIIVPYDLESPPPVRDGKALGWMSRADFTRLWDAAQPRLAESSGPRPYLAALWLEGALDTERRVITGTLTIEALNAGDVPAALPLRMKDLMIGEDANAADAPNGAALEASPDGLTLMMGARWAGRIEAPFTWPVSLTGRDGRLALEFPEAGAGAWTVRLPWPRAEITEGGAAAVVRESGEGVALTGAARPGALAVAWRGDSRRMESAGPDAGAAGWRADIEIHATWTMLDGAAWTALLTLKPADAGALLPREVRLRADSGLLITQAAGPRLAGARVPDERGGEVALTLRPCAEAEITLTGIIPMPAAADGAWTMPGLRRPDGVEGKTRVRLDIGSRIEIIAVTPGGMNRLASPPAEPGVTSQLYEASAPDWSAALTLRQRLPVFDATSAEARFPHDGFVWGAARVEIRPRASSLNILRLDMPEGAHVLSAAGSIPLDWAQSGRALWIMPHQPADQPWTLDIMTRAPLAEGGATLEAASLAVADAVSQRRTLAAGVPSGVHLRETALAGAEALAPDDTIRELAARLESQTGDKIYSLRAFELRQDDPLVFRLVPYAETAVITAFNTVTVSDGVQSLVCELRAVPRAGQFESVEALLILPAPDPEAAARLEASGPVRRVDKEMLSDTVMRVNVELRGPHSQPVTVRFQLDTRANTEGGQALRPTVMQPRAGGGARALLLMRRAFEGEVVLADAAGAAPLDRAAVKNIGAPFTFLPADQLFELNLAGQAAPAFQITRHARQQALRAIVEVLRERVILTPDGFERHELEIVLQNQSEQFLRVALAHPAARIELYEARVAGRVVRTSFAQEGGREALLIPLIRTGLLEPELTVRVVYTVTGQPALKGRGERRQQLPEILGGVPVVQSALVLMMPATLSYSDFEGTLNRVELVDLELDEVLRRTKKLEQISEAALYTQGETRVRALTKVQEMQKTVEFGYKMAEQTVEAYGRNIAVRAKAGDKDARDEAAKEQELSQRRNESLEGAKLAQSNVMTNVGRLNEIVAQQQLQQLPQGLLQSVPVQELPMVAAMAVEPAPAFAEPIAFPRTGTVFVFRQLQGTGGITFSFASRESAARFWDILTGALIVLGAGLAAGLGRRLFATRRRAAAVIIAVCAVAVLFKAALDLAIPGLAIGLLLWLTGRRKIMDQGITNSVNEA